MLFMMLLVMETNNFDLNNCMNRASDGRYSFINN
jgi:hypothetical protein